LVVEFTWTDDAGNQGNNNAVCAVTYSPIGQTGSAYISPCVIRDNAGFPISYQTIFNGFGSGTIEYELFFTVERLE
jgi:hypothetical protein